MKNLLLCISLLLSLPSFAQEKISGLVIDENNEAVIGASVLLSGTYDGTTTDLDGKFNFTTAEKGLVELQISYLGYKDKKIKADITKLENLQIALSPSAMALDAVEISASTFKAGDNSKVAVLKPMDIVTTAGAMGDVVAALQTLPGTQSNSEDGRLFVRGGDARETSIYIDGLKVFSPYTRSIGGSPVRGRFSPFLFKGVSFSTGGYAAEFGQALSGVLDMQTSDINGETQSNINIMSVGVGMGHSQNWDDQSLTMNFSYFDLAPYNAMGLTNAEWTNPYAGFSGEAVYINQLRNGLLKSYLAGDIGGFGIQTDNFKTDTEELIEIENNNIYSNTSYSTILNESTSAKLGISAGKNFDQLNIDSALTLDHDFMGMHVKAGLKTIVKHNFILNYGVEHFFHKDEFENSGTDYNFKTNLSRSLTAAFFESDYYLSRNLAAKPGLRLEYNHLENKVYLNPRLTLAQKLTENSQLSFAFGEYTQEVSAEHLSQNMNLTQESARHILANYNFKTEKHIFRLEGFYKTYKNLLTYNNENGALSQIANNGEGSTYGIDVFWRANRMIKNFEFWMSYSWLNNNRKYLDYPEEATPSFSTDHNLSIVTKTFVSKINTQIGISYTLASGRPYENPNTIGFQNERSKVFNNISMSVAHLISPQKILFVSLSNAPNFKNEFGYEYKDQVDESGMYPANAIKPLDNQFFFVGMFITLSKDKNKNQLDNL